MVLAAVAFVDASYLSYKAYEIRFGGGQVVSSFCDITKNTSCSEVLYSPYSQIFGISFPWVAFFVYPIIFLLAYLGYKKQDIYYAKVIQILSAGGMLFNFYIIYLETFYIFAFCLLCLLCTLIISSIFVVSTLEIRDNQKVV